MSKKRNRQPDANCEHSEGSTESCEETSTDNKCPHIAKAVNLNKIKKNIKKTGIAAECSLCKKEDNDTTTVNEEIVSGPSALWICLQCGNQGCGRDKNEHAVEHYKKPHSDCHFLVADTRHWNVWCYHCESEVNSASRKKLQETVEFVKKSASTPLYTSYARAPANQCQNEVIDADNEKENVLSNLPKVGGLVNLGNTCFFNAVLQCLAQTPFLVKILDDLRLPGQKFVLPGGKHKVNNGSEEIELPPIEGTLERWGSFTSILCKTLVEMQNTSGQQTYSPSELLNSFKKKAMQCMDGGQHDSHELLRHLLELVRNEDLRRYQSIILKEVGLNGKTNPEGVEDSLKSRVKFYGNQASARLLGPEPVFRGVLVSTLECLDCHHSSQSTEPFLDLSLPVMADKPQPPILKRKNSGLEESFDMMGNNIHSHGPSKHQLKKEKKAARKNRKNRRQECHDNVDSLNNQNNITEENNGSVLQSEESDADVEDNVEAESLLPEVGESGYSSEKPSALGSPVSPSSGRRLRTTDPPPLLLDNLLPLSPIENLLEPLTSNPITPSGMNSPSPTDVSMAELTQTKLSDRVESSESPENEVGVHTGVSLSTSLAVNSDLTSPEAPTASFSSVNSKESPGSPDCGGLINNSGLCNEDDKLERLEGSRESRRKSRRKTDDYLDSLNGECNGIHLISTGISKMTIGHESPTRYTTKEGECSVQSCLNQFTALELMSGSNKVGCEACTAREQKVKENCKMVCTPSTKQYLISKVPAVLILHLKRFQAQRIDFRKVTKHVSFPILLDLAPVCKGHKKSRIYSLYGVVEHSGTIHGGHYVAYVKTRMPLTPDDPRWSFLPSKDAKDTEDSSNSSSGEDSETEEAAASPTVTNIVPPPGKWYYVSDSRVTEVDESTVLQRQAYLLFYERIL